MLQNKYGSLAGKILIAAPQVSPKSYFAKRVIYLVRHGTNDGAIGLIINQPLSTTSDDMFAKYKIHTSAGVTGESVGLGSVEAYTGGPIEGETGFILHADQSHPDPKDEDEIYISSSLQLLKNILKGKGPKHSMFLFGYCGWENGQLEEEIKNNTWLVLNADKKLIFETNSIGKWDAALSNLNIHPALYLTKAGHC